MTVVEHYQCDVTNEIYEEQRDVQEFPLRIRSRHPYNIHKTSLHISKEFLEEFKEEHGRLSVPANIDFLGVNRTNDEGEVVTGAVLSVGEGASWYDRGDYMLENYEPFFEFVDEEILW